jgi:hypothetical protein
MKRKNNPGIEWTEIAADYGEVITISNSLTNGLRIELFNGDIDDIACFHIADMQTAMQIAEVLTEYSKRIANPPMVPE